MNTEPEMLSRVGGWAGGFHSADKGMTVGTLRSNNGDVHENVAGKQTSHHFEIFCDYPILPRYLKEGDFGCS